MNWGYLFKHWFGTLILAPLIGQIIEHFTNNSNQIFDYFETYILFLIFGLFFSTPTYLLYSLIYWFLGQKNINKKYAKIILILFAIAGIIITFGSIGGSFGYKGTLIYSLSSIITGLFLKLNLKNNDNHKPHH